MLPSCYFVLLRITSYYFVLLRITSYYFVLLRITSYYFVLLKSTLRINISKRVFSSVTSFWTVSILLIST